MVAGFSAVNAALRFQIENCLRDAERFMENPREVTSWTPGAAAAAQPA